MSFFKTPAKAHTQEVAKTENFAQPNDGKGKKNHIGFVLDESGSMASLQMQTIKGFNDYLRSVTETMHEDTIFSMYVFGKAGNDSNWNPRSKIVCTASRKPLKQVLPLNRHSYRPYGSTPLYDTVNQMIKEVDAWKRENPAGQPIIVVQTDGEDTCSSMNVEDLESIITQKRKEGWIFILLGAGLDAERLGKKMGIDPQQSLSYKRGNTAQAYEAATHITMRAAKVEKGDPVFSIEDKRNLK